MINRQWIYLACPDGALGAGHFAWREAPAPQPRDGEVLVRVRMSSVDPAQRMWMSMHSYRPRLQPGEVMAAYGVGEVVASRAPGFAPGDVVSGDLGWQDFCVTAPQELRKRDAGRPLEQLAGVLDITGLTAYFGLFEIASVRAGETLLVSAAAGGVGNVVVQLARRAGVRVVGVAGGAQKCRWLLEELGADATIDYKLGGLRAALKTTCPDGIDAMFDGTGGDILEAALPQMNPFGRVACCGAVAQYDRASAAPGPRGVPGLLVARRIRMQGFVVFDHYARRDEAEARLARWLDEGSLKPCTQVADGLEAAPAALIGQLAGANVGKMLVRV